MQKHNERTYRQLNTDVNLDDGIERARRRHYYKLYHPQEKRSDLRGYIALVVLCVGWALFYEWLVNR